MLSLESIFPDLFLPAELSDQLLHVLTPITIWLKWLFTILPPLKNLFIPISTPKPSTKPIVSVLHLDKNTAQLFSDHLNSKLDPANIPTDLDALCQHISTSISKSVETICPKSTLSKSPPPWENSDLQELMTKLRTEPSNSAIQTEIREKRKLLKDQYYSQKATEINCAAEARQVEKEFILAKNFRMHKTSSSKIDISKEKLTKHFENIFWKGCVNFHLNW